MTDRERSPKIVVPPPSWQNTHTHRHTLARSIKETMKLQDVLFQTAKSVADPCLSTQKTLHAISTLYRYDSAVNGVTAIRLVSLPLSDSLSRSHWNLTNLCHKNPQQEIPDSVDKSDFPLFDIDDIGNCARGKKSPGAQNFPPVSRLFLLECGAIEQRGKKQLVNHS